MRRSKGRVYLLKFLLPDGIILHKIGITKRRLKTRILEIVDSFYDVYKFIPQVEVIRGLEKSSRCYNYFKVEADILASFNKYKVDWTQVKSKRRISGASEFRRDLSTDTIEKVYDKTMKERGHVIDNETLEESLEQVKVAHKKDGMLGNTLEPRFLTVEARF